MAQLGVLLLASVFSLPHWGCEAQEQCGGLHVLYGTCMPQSQCLNRYSTMINTCLGGMACCSNDPSSTPTDFLGPSSYAGVCGAIYQPNGYCQPLTGGCFNGFNWLSSCPSIGQICCSTDTSASGTVGGTQIVGPNNNQACWALYGGTNTTGVCRASALDCADFGPGVVGQPISTCPATQFCCGTNPALLLAAQQNALVGRK